MRKSGKAYVKKGSGAVAWWMIMVLGVCIAVRLLTASGAGEKLDSLAQRFWESEKLIETLLSLELGVPVDAVAVYKESEDKTEEMQDTEHVFESAIPEYEAETQEKEEKLDYTATGIFETDEHLDASGIEFDNDAGIEINADELLNSPLNFTVNTDEPTVLIVHTHGSEAYTPAGEDIYTESDPFRTEDSAYNVVRVGQELKAELESYGISVLHDETLHDYPSYNGSYNRCFETIAGYIDKYPSIKIVIDLHRDAIENYDGTPYRTAAHVEGETCSQLLFVMGTNASGLDHPAWQENMKLAIKLQYAMNEMFPGLAKPICVSQYRYNQHMTSGSMILEVGSTGNTLQESISSMKYFAAAAAEVISSAVEKEN